MIGALFLVLLGCLLGCITILLSVAYAIAARDGHVDSAYSLLISASGAMVLSISFAVLAGRLLA